MSNLQQIREGILDKNLFGFLILSLNQQFAIMVDGEYAYFEHVIVL
jgi:hypothetical protein